MSRLSAMLVDVKTETRTPPISPHGSFETIRSGQFMVSTLNDTDILSEDESQSPNSVSSKDAATHATLYGAPPDAKPSEDDLSVATTSSSASTSTSTRPPAGFDFRNACQEARHLNCQFGGGGQPPTFGIDESLTKLLECMTITYRTQITNPKWNSFRGLKVSMRDKIRLNNIIWREYHMQFVKKKRPIVVQFTSALSENHANPEAIVMEGKYWKRKLQIVRQEYQSCRQVLRHLTSRNSHSKRGSYSGVKGSGSGGPGGVGGALGAGGAGVVGDLALTQSPQPRRIRQRSLSHLETGGLGGGVVPNLSAEELVGEQHQMMMELEEHMNYIQQHHNSTVGGGGVVGVGMNTQSPGTMLDDLMMATFDDLDMSLFEPSSSTMMWNADVIQPDLSQLQPNVDDISNLELFSTVFPMSSTTSGPTTSMMLMESQTHFMYAPQQQISMSNNLPTTTMEFMDIDSTAASQQLSTLMGDSRFASSSSSSSAYHASKTSESRFPVSSSSHHLPPAPPRYRSTKSSEETPLPQANYLQQEEMVMLKSSPFTSVTSSSPRKEESVDSIRYQQQQLHYQNQSQSRSYHDIHRGATHNTSTEDVPHRQMSATHLSSYSERSKSTISAGGSSSSATNSSVSMPPAGTGRGSLPNQLVAIAPKPEMTTYTQPVMQAMPPPPPRHQSVSEVIFTSGQPHETASSSSGVYSQHNTAHSPLRRVMEELDTKSFDTSSSVGGSELDGSSRSYLARRQPSCVNITQGFSQLENLLRQLQASQQQQPNSTASSLHPGGQSTSSLSSSASSTSRSSSNPGPGVMLMSTLGPKTSKATLLHKAAEHIRRMKEQQRRMDHEISMLETEIHMLQGDLNHSCSQLPATGVDLNKRPSQQGQAWFQEFVLHRSATHWKFYPFSLFLRRLFLTYNATLANVNASMLPLAVRSWLEQHCAMLSLRQLATDSLREMIHTTSILTTPQCVPEEVAHLVSEKRRALLAEIASLRHAPPPPQQRMALPPPPPPPSAPAPSPPVMPVPSVHSKPLLRPAPSHPPPPRYPSPLATSSSSSKVPLYAISSSQQLRPRAVASSTGMYHHLHAHQPSSAAFSSSTSSGSTAPPSSSPGVPSSNHFFDVPFHQPKRPGTTVGRGGPRGAPASKRNVPS